MQVGEQAVCSGMAALSKLICVYVVHPIDGEGHSHTLHRSYLLPIRNNLEQEEGENAMGGGSSNEPTSVPPAEDALQVDHPTES